MRAVGRHFTFTILVSLENKQLESFSFRSLIFIRFKFQVRFTENYVCAFFPNFFSYLKILFEILQLLRLHCSIFS